MSGRAVVALLLMVGVLTGLTACGVPHDPIFFRAQGDVFLIKTCKPLVAKEIVVQTAPHGTLQYGVVWQAEGVSGLEVDDELIYGVLPDGWTAKVGPKPLDLTKDDVLVTIGDAIVPGQLIPDDKYALQGGFTPGIPSSGWVDSGGTVVDNPCSHSQQYN